MRLLPLVSVLLAASALRAEGPPTPRHAPEFVLQYVDGKQELLSSYRGSVVMIEFLHTTCPHCQAASKVFSTLNTEFAGKGFKPIGVAWDDYMVKMRVPDFIKMTGANYPIAYSDRDKVLDFLQYSIMQRTVVPQIVWIDRKGMIRSQTNADAGGEEMRQEPYWRDMIVKLTSEPDSAGKKTAALTRKAAK